MKKIKRQNKNNTILMSDGFKFSRLHYLIAKKITFSGNFISINGDSYYQHDKTKDIDFEVFSKPSDFVFDYEEFEAA
jgi:hypothetical protein